MVIIKFSVKGQELRLETDLRKAKVTSDTINYFKCQFTFDNKWDGFEKRAYFKNASFNITKSALLDENNCCFIPWEVLAHTGVILCNLTGVKFTETDTERITAGPVKFFLHNSGSEEQLVKKIKDNQVTVDPLSMMLQKEEGTIEPDYQTSPTLTEFEQFMALVKRYLARAEVAEAKMENLTVSATVGEEGSDPEVTKTDYPDHYNLDFTIPRGVPGKDGVRGGVTLGATTAPSEYTTQVGDYTPAYRISLDTILASSGISEIYAGDVIEYEHYRYPIGYVDDDYAYTGERTSIQGVKGTDGEDAALVYIHSSEGMAFKNDAVETVLTVTIYYGSTTIVDKTGLESAFGYGSYLQWKVKIHGESDYSTIPSSDPRLSNDGFTFEISPADVNVQAVFVVQVIIPD